MKHKEEIERPLPQGAALRKYFFQCNSAVAVSDLVVCMAAGTVLKVDRIPTELLPAVVLLATIGIRDYQQQIIDDYGYLLQRFQDTINEPSFTHKVFDHPQLYLAALIAQRGPRGEYLLNELPEASYIFQVYEELANADIEELFQGVKEKTAAK